MKSNLPGRKYYLSLGLLAALLFSACWLGLCRMAEMRQQIQNVAASGNAKAVRASAEAESQYQAARICFVLLFVLAVGLATGTTVEAIRSRNNEIAKRQQAEQALQMARAEMELRLEQQTNELHKEIQERIDGQLQLVLSNQQLEESERRLRSILESEPECVNLVSQEGAILEMNPAGLRMVEAARPRDIVGRPIFSIIAPEYHDLFRSLNEDVFKGESRMAELEIIGLNGGRRWVETHACPLRDSDGRISAQLAVSRDITERREAELELNRMHKELIETSRMAGMAEVATSVLHNVGNVLNSVNVSAVLVAGNVKKSRIVNLGRVAELLETHSADLGNFVTNHPQGKQLPGYLRQLSERLAQEQQSVLAEVESLRQNIEHIKDIVSMQQSYGKVSGVVETVRIGSLVDDALRMNSEGLNRHSVEVVRECDEGPLVAIEKHKVVQILVNLIHNAEHACIESNRPDKRVTIRVSYNPNRIKISVLDNGIGISPENLTRIFAHGFTTKKDGHGFGLHSAALAAKELGGHLRGTSDGVGCGAAFTLDFPLPAPSPKVGKTTVRISSTREGSLMPASGTYL